MKKFIAKLLTFYIPIKSLRKKYRERIFFCLEVGSWKRRKTIIYVAPGMLAEIGGVETRLIKFFKYFSFRGYRIVVITSKATTNSYVMSNYKTYILGFDNGFLSEESLKSENVTAEILEIAKKEKASLIEFNLCTPRDYYIDYELISKEFPVGFHLHSSGVSFFNNLGYNIVNSRKNVVDNQPFKVVLNPMDEDLIENVFKFSSQKKALLISRLDDDKAGVVYPAIDFFINNNIDFEIAGAPMLKKQCLTNVLKKRYSLTDEHFIGKIDTSVFLKENIEHYFCVAGVGQVVLEAGALGYPVLLATRDGEAEFITSDDFENYMYYNLTRPKESKHVSAEEQFKEIMQGDVEKYNLVDGIKRNYSLNSIGHIYEEIIKDKIVEYAKQKKK